MDCYSELVEEAEKSYSRDKWHHPFSLWNYRIDPDEWSLVDMWKGLLISGDIRLDMKQRQWNAKHDLIHKSGYSQLAHLNDRVSCKLANDYLNNPTVDSKYVRFYLLVRQGRLPTEVYKAKTIKDCHNTKCIWEVIMILSTLL